MYINILMEIFAIRVFYISSFTLWSTLLHMKTIDGLEQ